MRRPLLKFTFPMLVFVLLVGYKIHLIGFVPSVWSVNLNLLWGPFASLKFLRYISVSEEVWFACSVSCAPWILSGY